jgi:hypothetical protein
MANPTLLQQVPKLASVAGGVALATGIPMLGFFLLTTSAIINLIGAIREKKRGDSGFFAAWACLNSWFATHSGGH